MYDVGLIDTSCLLVEVELVRLEAQLNPSDDSVVGDIGFVAPFEGDGLVVAVFYQRWDLGDVVPALYVGALPFLDGTDLGGVRREGVGDAVRWRDD